MALHKCLLFVAVSLTVANAAFTPSSLVSFLNAIAGKHTISGQYIEFGPLTPVEQIFNQTGKWLGLIGGDYYYYGQGDFQANHDFNNIAVSYWQAGGIITLSCHMPNPTTGKGINDVSYLNAKDLLTAGTTTNNNFMTILNSIAAGLKQLKSSGVVVIWRPFHEMNGNWFWYGTSFLSDSEFIQLWQFVHGYMTNNMGLDNIVWLYAANSGMNVQSRFPGKQYADIVGHDLYTNDPSQGQSTYQSLANLGKPIVLAEFGPGNPNRGDRSFNEMVLISSIRSTMPNTVFWQQWWDGNAGNTGWGMGECQGVAQALHEPWVLNRGDLKLLAAKFSSQE